MATTFALNEPRVFPAGTVVGAYALADWENGEVIQNASPPLVSEVQTVTITGAPDGGTFTLTYAGQTTAAIAFDATAATVKTRLEALSNIGVDDVAVSGSAGGPYTVTFQNALATNVTEMTASGASLTGGTSPDVEIATTTEGEGYTNQQTVASDGTLTFTGLTDDTDYAAYALVGGAHRYILFSTKDRSKGIQGLSLGIPVEVEGVRDDPEEALAALLTALDSLGLITDSTTAT